jgi:regulator of protease activity HflC (stomatin/prohibitin superfamily)
MLRHNESIGTVTRLTAFSRERWKRYLLWWRRVSPRLWTYLALLTLAGAFLTVYFWPLLWNRVFLSLRPGEAGVLWERFLGGTDIKHVYREGFHLVMPWNRMYIYNLRLQQTSHKIIALCKNGLPVEIEVSIRSRPQVANLPLLHVVVGEHYLDVVVKPEIEAHVRGVVSQFNPEELYSSEGYILNLIVQGAMGKIAERYVSLDNLLIKRVQLPVQVGDAIQAKLVEEQRALEYEFRLQQAESEAERKTIEAKGILAFQQTVTSGGRFEDYLRYAGIQATLELSKSDNAKVVVIGGERGLPLLSFNLGGGEAHGPGAPLAPPKAPAAPSPKADAAARSAPVELPIRAKRPAVKPTSP